jgi:hypothetical protein
MQNSDPVIHAESPCQACGACCSYSSNWPRFTTEDDAALDLIPENLVNAKMSGMRCDGDRCSARGLPNLHARRSRMHDGAEEIRPAGVDINQRVVPAKAGTTNTASLGGDDS